MAISYETDGFSIKSRSDAVIRVDTDGRILAVNDAALALLGYESDEIRGEPLAAILDEGSLAAWMMQGLRDAGAIVSEERTLVTKARERVPVVFSGVVVCNDAGDPAEILWIARKLVTTSDVAERLRATETTLKRERADRRRLTAELQAARDECDKRRKENETGKEEGGQGGKDQLWEWAEEELRRVQATFQRTREKLYRVEEERNDAVKQRDWAEERRLHSEEELQRLKDELQRVERHAQAAENEHAASSRKGGRAAEFAAQKAKRDGSLPARPGPADGGARQGMIHERYAALIQQPSDFPAGHGIDWSDALASVDGDVDLLRAIATSFSKDSPRMLSDLRAAAENGNRQMIERQAGFLKDASKTLGAHVAMQAAARLEAIAHSSDLTEAEEAYIALQLEIEKLKPALTALQRSD